MSARQRDIVLRAVGVIALLAIGLLTYGFVLRLPFFSDDMAHARFLQTTDLGGLWRTAWGLGYYRPLPATLWKALSLLQGRFDPVALHALNLALHLLNGLLVAGLAMALGRGNRLALGLAAELLFLVYPFSYQAVPWVGSLTHLLVTALILGSLLLYLAGMRRRSRLLKAASLALALLAPFAHETGVLVAPLLALALLADERRLAVHAIARQTLPYGACAALGFAAWLLVPKGTSPAALGRAEALWRNGMYLAQGLAYPAAPLALRLSGRPAMLALFMAGAVAAWALLLWAMGQRRLVILSLGWFAVAVAPAWVSLDPEYVQSGPRLLYLASVGAGLFWAIPLDLAWSCRPRRVLAVALGAVAVLGIASGSYRYIRQRARLYEQVRRAATELVAVRPADPSRSLLCVNYPMWFALRTPTFPLGHDGVVFVPDYTNVADLLWLHTGEERPVTSVIFPDLLPQDDWRYIFPCYGTHVDGGCIQAELRKAGGVAVTRYEGENVAIYDAGGLEAVGRPPAGAYLATYARQVALRSMEAKRVEGQVRVELHWQCWAPPAEETTVFLHLYDSAGRLVAQADGFPVLGTSRLVAWQPGDEWRDVRWLTLPDSLAPGDYALKTGLYTVQDGARLAAEGPAGEGFQDEAVPLGTVSLPG